MSALDVAAQPEPTADCSTPGCDKAGTMACPTCIKLGLPPSRYCSQVGGVGLPKACRGALVIGQSPHYLLATSVLAVGWTSSVNPSHTEHCTVHRSTTLV